ncbi:MAG: hypothetical protein IH621_01935 [Krumholzibacteria bacterium]|nr:hypothetical protein [Candidatus Krumholzibacteria bacterium]
MKITRIMIIVAAAGLWAGCASSHPPVNKAAQAAPTESAKPEDSLEAGFQLLADKIVAGLKSQQANKIAVAPFQDLDGSVSEFGGFVAEEMTTRLYNAGSFGIVEREMLDRVMAEHELATTGLIDESTAKQLGKLLGVDAIATGTITDLGDEIRVNSRLIATETGSVFSAAAVTLPKDERVANLMARGLTAGAAAGAKAASGARGARNQAAAYVEEFAEVGDGMIPDGWLGGESVHVVEDGTRTGHRILQPFRKGPYRFTIPDLAFPEDWKVTIDVKLLGRHSYNSNMRLGGRMQVWTIGDVTVSLYPGYANLNDSGARVPIPKDLPFRAEIEKSGPVIKLSIDGNRVLMVRVPTLETPRSIVFHDPYSFELDRIAVEAAPGER